MEVRRAFETLSSSALRRAYDARQADAGQADGGEICLAPAADPSAAGPRGDDTVQREFPSMSGSARIAPRVYAAFFGKDPAAPRFTHAVRVALTSHCPFGRCVRCVAVEASYGPNRAVRASAPVPVPCRTSFKSEYRRAFAMATVFGTRSPHRFPRRLRSSSGSRSTEAFSCPKSRRVMYSRRFDPSLIPIFNVTS